MTGRTKAWLLRHSISFALTKVRLWGKKLKLSDEERIAIADETIKELRRYGGWRDLDDELEIPTGHSTRRD
ncbi:MAG: hypothetical protein ACXWKA_12355 [Xanthobacteraceae bacterium]